MTQYLAARCSFAKALCLSWLALAPCLLSATGTAAAAPPKFEEIQPLLATYCYKCHRDEKKKAGLNLAKFKSESAAHDSADVWELVGQRIKDGEMPPEDSEQPTKEEDAKLLEWAQSLPKAAADCRKLATDQNQHFYKGYVMSRRLSRAEYDNSIRDLVGLDLKPSQSFPADGSGGEGFDTSGDALFTSAVLMEKYLDAADAVVKAALPDDGDAPLSPEIEAARKQILVAMPGGQVTPRDAARQVAFRFARRAFRRPIADAEVERLLTMFDRGQTRGDSFEASLRLVLKAVLISPHFLFLVEPEAEKEGVHRLAQYPLASRLSYFLWSSIPDEELLALAEGEQLHDPEVLRGQVQRMLKDPRSKALAENFATQWLGIGGLGSSSIPDPHRFQEFNAELADAMRAEAVLYFDAIIREDRSLLELLASDYTFVNERLAKHYGIAGVSGSEMQRVKLNDPNRGGVLSLASVLTVTSYPLRTSPVLRGKWVLETVLGGKMRPPPPDAGTLPPDDVQTDGLTLRKRLELHRSNAECASCHERMDPLGFGLENFDPIGRWRTEQAGKPLDASGRLASGEEFKEASELKAVLLKRKGEFLRNFARKMLGYALGREVNKFDRCVIDDAVKALEAGDYRSSILIEQIVLSYPFQFRYTKK